MSQPAVAPRRGRRQRGAAIVSGPVSCLVKWVGALVLTMVQAMTAAPAPVMIQGSPGRFEISAVDPTLAHGVAAAAEEAWRILSVPLALPQAFPSPVYFRINPAEEAKADATPFRVTVEIGGIVSVRLRADAATAAMTRRALVQSLLMRLAVAKHGVTQYLTVPLWLEHACVGYWQTRADAARLDALKQFASRESPPTVETLVNLKRGEPEPQSHVAAAMWLMAFLQSESGRTGEWSTLLLRLLQGDDPLIAVVLSYPGRFNSAESRELWWRTGYHHLRRVRTLPALELDDSREQLGALARFVYSDPAGDRDVIVPLAGVLARFGEPIVNSELTRRSSEVAKLLTTLHPFYRNAGLSLSEAFAARELSAAKRERAITTFEQDWRDAVELEAATRRSLDELERKMAAPAP